MTWQHLRAFVWLRWRLLANSWQRGGSLNFVLTAIFVVAALVSAVPLFIVSVLVGYNLPPSVTPKHLLYAWDGMAIAFTFFWSVGLLAELQRTEPLSLSKFLHLPVSLRSAFFINYVSSACGLTTILLGPVMVGFALGLTFSRGLAHLAALPLVAAFVLLISAVSYQFQGWLASLMSNPRRRRTVVVGATAVFILIAQLPNLVNFAAPVKGKADRSLKLQEQFDQLNREFMLQQIDAQEHLRRQQEVLAKHNQEDEQAAQAMVQRWERVARLLNWALPIGWLPLGAMSAAEGNIGVSLATFTAMTLLGSASLWRAYGTTIRLYRGEFVAGSVAPGNVVSGPERTAAEVTSPAPAPARKSRVGLLEARLPSLSEPVSVIALAGFRSLLRSPEAKMMLLTPLIMTTIAGGALFRHSHDMPDLARPLPAVGAVLVVLFGMAQLMANQFGFDRDGFRAFVLCAAPRRDILLGKNLGFLPMAGGMAALLIAGIEFFAPLRFDQLLAMLPQFVSMFLLFCLLANLVSIYAPMAISAGSFKRSHVKAVPVFLQMLTFFFAFPLMQLPTFVPLGAELISEGVGWTHGVPIFLPLAAVECGIVVVLYGRVLSWQGRLLQAREQKILESVTKTAA
ncbi:MAG TPA: hypothetical protein VHC22_16740 [Pirellulales bacterium]|nr:hypothetical protein [Pirellulales bacterium]